ncbi:hypothetical protein AAG747_17600 [Rapidithrix thailandica]|uniref:Uncharacterized protein n=1 Tax=Rapidithrix thailandica TaxID=413964 RepID=A0AAW9S797_9BACT
MSVPEDEDKARDVRVPNASASSGMLSAQDAESTSDTESGEGDGEEDEDKSRDVRLP